ncbi:PTS lactose/cellobiose transporter subunit IIA [Virgibacillus oceani]|uniref:Lichenan-specific phosphotransferase enzyme IIA component n=1 Tax=Virgibacillus oceani TaxID=1479511 RepID=A0A917HBN8_9BACI|nr:PTS lactose/cellobiose transporter subunit IIA [Virgibacillus oceani]GGG73666.1 lichenan-specific phosphotransferase enzyme IIA component [Virgibacillus oceani]
MESTEDMQMLSFNIILHAGNARSNAMEAIALAKDYKFSEAREKIQSADQEFAEAHHVQTKLLQDEASGEKNDVTVILVHAQDHLMTAMTVKDLANEMIDMYEKMKSLEEKQP